MTTTALSTTNLTLLDRVKRSRPDGSIETTIVEMLTQRNAVIKDAVSRPGNLPTGMRVTSRRGLPSVGYKKFNAGIAASKSTTDQFDEACGRVEAWAVTDCALADLGGDAGSVRMTENQAFLQAMSNEVETGIFYNSTKTSPEKWMGFAPRMSATTDTAGGQIELWSGSSSGSDQASMWLVGWGDNTVHLITPQGSPDGLQHEDFGRRPWLDGSSNPYSAYVSQFHWSIGVCVQDWRYLSRVANIDTSAVTATGTDILTAMTLADHQLFSKSGIRPAWYCNRKIGAYLHLQSLSKSVYQITQKEVGGEYVTSFLGVPVRETDALTNAEAIIS